MTFFDYPTGELDPAEAEATPGAQYLLPDATDQDWADLLRYTRTRTFAAGETVISRGIGGRSLFIVIEGTLEVLVPTARGQRRQAGHSGQGWRQVATFGPGAVIGELSFFDGQGRSASVRALTEAELAELGVADFDAMAGQHPQLGRRLLFDLGRILAQRLRVSTQSSAAAG